MVYSFYWRRRSWQAVDETLALPRPVLCDADGNWTADCVRLRFAECAGRPANYEVSEPHDHSSPSHPLRVKLIMRHPSWRYWITP
jgi:hypothetical protein